MIAAIIILIASIFIFVIFAVLKVSSDWDDYEEESQNQIKFLNDDLSKIVKKIDAKNKNSKVTVRKIHKSERKLRKKHTFLNESKIKKIKKIKNKKNFKKTLDKSKKI